MRVIRLPLYVVSLLLLACSGEAVRWSDVTVTAPPRPRGIPIALPEPDACPVSVRGVRAGHDLVAVWWAVRPDSSGLLLVAHSSDGGTTWSLPVIADSTDAGVRGCGRPAPSIVTDSTSGYVHIAYFSEPQSGRGIFFAHSMDGGRTFHAPVPIIFGDNPGFVAVASEGDRVAVAYDDPNSAQPAIGVALSSTMGHLFHPGQIVSTESERAKQPTVELRGDTIRIWWSDYAADPRISATRIAYREGIWR